MNGKPPQRRKCKDFLKLEFAISTEPKQQPLKPIPIDIQVIRPIAASVALQKITYWAKYAIGRQRIRMNSVELYTQAKFYFEDPPNSNPSPQPPAPTI